MRNGNCSTVRLNWRYHRDVFNNSICWEKCTFQPVVCTQFTVSSLSEWVFTAGYFTQSHIKRRLFFAGCWLLSIPVSHDLLPCNSKQFPKVDFYYSYRKLHAKEDFIEKWKSQRKPDFTSYTKISVPLLETSMGSTELLYNICRKS